MTTHPTISAALGADRSDRADPIMLVQGLTKRFPVKGRSGSAVHALSEAYLNLRPGEIVALVGESGSGKSTLAKLLVRLIPATAGDITVLGATYKAGSAAAKRDYRRNIQMVFQDPFSSLNPVHPIGYQLRRVLRIHKMTPKAQENARAAELLETVGISPGRSFLGVYPHELSGGQRQRVAIARVLAADPKIIIADEPTSMLDVSIRMGILNLIRALAAERRIAFLYITHDLASARYVSDQTMVMYAGHIVESGSSAQVTNEPLHPYTRLLISAVPDPGHPYINSATPERGEVPSLIDPAPGCPFVNRCSEAMAVCRQTMPEPTYLSPERWVRCHAVAQSADCDPAGSQQHQPQES